MPKALLSLILAAQMLLPLPVEKPAPLPESSCPPASQDRLWWGMIDPELSLWFSRLPIDEQIEQPILWDWSWRCFLAALFGQPLTKEALPHA